MLAETELDAVVKITFTADSLSQIEGFPLGFEKILYLPSLELLETL